MTEFKLMNCGIEILCILFCIVLLTQRFVIKAKQDTDKWYKIAVVANIAMLLGDITDWTLSGIPGAHITFIYNFGMTVYFVSSGVLMFSFMAYIYSCFNHKAAQPKYVVRIGIAMMVTQIFFAVISPLTGAIFVILDNNVYSRGSLFFVSQLTAVVVFSMGFWLYIRNFKLLTVKEKIYFLLYLILPTVGEFVQAFSYGIAILNVAVTVSFLFVTLFVTSELEEQLRQSEEDLEQERLDALKKQQANQELLIEQTIMALSNAVEAKDRYTHGHSYRVARYAREITARMGSTPDEQKRVYYTGLLHDVGKLKISDAIINKTTKLTIEEYDEMKLHTLAGYHILKEISSISDFAIGARWHHERYDGNGYPNGLKGDNIPLIARVICVADAYDAMTSNRTYRSILPREKVRQEIVDGMGTQFDPDIAQIMLDMIDEDTYYYLHQPSESREKVILAVDDDPRVLEHIEFILKAWGGCRLLTGSTGQEALEIIQNQTVDLLLIDVELKDMNGFDMLEKMKEMKPSLSVIFLTGEREMKMIQKAERMGISDYLSKPLVPKMLYESLENVFLRSKRNE